MRIHPDGNKVWFCSKHISKHKSQKPLPKFAEPLNILQIDDNHTYFVERNGRASRKYDSRLKNCPTRQGMMVGRKHRQVETVDMRGSLESQ